MTHTTGRSAFERGTSHTKSFTACLACTILLHCSSFSQSFESFLNAALAAPPADRPAMVEGYMATIARFPSLENPSTVVYMYRGSASDVFIAGDINGWVTDADRLTLLPGTDFWHLLAHYEPDARLEYKFVIDGTQWTYDPLNVRFAPGMFGNSELRMAYYVGPVDIVPDPGIPHGSVWDTTFFSVNLGNSRVVQVYTPPGYAATDDSFAVILFHDGQDYLSTGLMNNILDYRIAHKSVRPLIALFVPPKDRDGEYEGPLEIPFMNFIVNEVLPVVDRRFRTRKDPASRAVAGASAGGNISLLLAMIHPDVFGNVLVQSSLIVQGIADMYLAQPRLSLRLSVDVGTYDLTGLLDMSRQFQANLQSAGYTYRYVEYHEGHNYGNWRAHVGDALQFLFPAAPSGVAEVRPEQLSYRLETNYPNPFNPSTIIGFGLPHRSDVTLTVFNTLGQSIATLVKGEQDAGNHKIRFDGSNLASGVYFYRIQAGTYVETKKLLLIR